jgi:outer membrane lipoprotein-sorting protein
MPIKNNNTPPSDAILDQAVRALKDSLTPAGPPKELVSAVLDKLPATSDVRRAGILERIILMNAKYKLAAAAGILAAVALVAWFSFDGLSPSVAFADVKRMVEKAQTMTCRVRVEGVPNPVQNTRQMTMKMMFKEPGRMRQELPEGVTSIIDFKTGKGLTLVPNEKIAVKMELGNIPGKKPGNFLDSTKKMMEGPHKDLGEKEINGVRVKGFRVDSPMGSCDLWVKRESPVPVQWDITLREPKMTVIMDDFVMDQELDDSLFSLAVPEGYKQQSMNMDMSNPTPRDVLNGLKTLAEIYDGKFPASLMIGMDDFKQAQTQPAKGAVASSAMSAAMSSAMVKLQQKIGKQTPEQQATVIRHWMRLFLYLSTQCPKHGWRYLGKDVSMGDAATVVLVYQSNDSKTATVVYGDLHVKEVDPQTLPENQRPLPFAFPGSAPAK